MHGQTGIFLDRHAGNIPDQSLDHRNALVNCEKFTLVGVDANANDEFVEELDAPANHVKMPVGNGIKLPGKHGNLSRLAGHEYLHVRSVAENGDGEKPPIAQMLERRTSSSGVVYY